MEPFEILRDMIRERTHPLIGGAPQMLKIYRHMNTKPYAIYWPNKDSLRITLFGRPLLDYETTESLVLNPDSLEMEKIPAFEERRQ
jgi:hypothetical protein